MEWKLLTFVSFINFISIHIQKTCSTCTGNQLFLLSYRLMLSDRQLRSVRPPWCCWYVSRLSSTLSLKGRHRGSDGGHCLGFIVLPAPVCPPLQLIKPRSPPADLHYSFLPSINVCHFFVSTKNATTPRETLLTNPKRTTERKR